MSRSHPKQNEFSTTFPDVVFDADGRTRKARTIHAVIKEFLGEDTKSSSLLDLGCSTGIITHYLSQDFRDAKGVDVDGPAIEYAQKSFAGTNCDFLLVESQTVPFLPSSFDVVVCNQVYEHVADAVMLLQEIRRVLKPGGICYFSAGNRFRIVEPHYHLPFLSAVPRPLAHVYIRMARKGTYYHEKHLSYWGLRRLVGDFRVIDYTRRIIEDPTRFHAEYLIKPGSPKAWAAKVMSRYCYWLCPSYIWLLVKEGGTNRGPVVT